MDDGLLNVDDHERLLRRYQQRQQNQQIRAARRRLRPIKVAITLAVLHVLGITAIIEHAVVRKWVNDFPPQTIDFDNTTILPAGTDLDLNYDNTEFPHMSLSFFETIQLSSAANNSLQASSIPQVAATVLSSRPSADGEEASLRIDDRTFSKVESFNLKSFTFGCFEVQKTGHPIKPSSPAKACTIEVIGYRYTIQRLLPQLWLWLWRTPRFISQNVTFDPQYTQILKPVHIDSESDGEAEATTSLMQMLQVNFDEDFHHLTKVEFRLVSDEPSRSHGVGD